MLFLMVLTNVAAGERGGIHPAPPCPSPGCSSNAAACPHAVVWPSRVTVVSPIIISSSSWRSGGGVAGSPSPASRMGRRVKRSRELALETISGTLKTSMPRGRLHVLSYQPGPSPRLGIALDYRAADMSHGTTSPFQVTGGPPTIC